MKPFLHFITKLFEKFYILIFIATVSGIIFAGVSLYIWPSFRGIRQQGSLDLGRLKQKEQKLQKHIEDLQTLKASFESFSSQQMKRLREILPKEPDLPALFVQASDIAEKNNMALVSINILKAAQQGAENVAQEEPTQETTPPSGGTPQEASPKNNELIAGIEELMITINVSGGSYTDLKNLLSDIERNLRLFDVTSINFGSIETRQYLINMKTYYLP